MKKNHINLNSFCHEEVGYELHHPWLVGLDGAEASLTITSTPKNILSVVDFHNGNLILYIVRSLLSW